MVDLKIPVMPFPTSELSTLENTSPGSLLAFGAFVHCRSSRDPWRRTPSLGYRSFPRRIPSIDSSFFAAVRLLLTFVEPACVASAAVVSTSNLLTRKHTAPYLLCATFVSSQAHGETGGEKSL